MIDIHVYYEYIPQIVPGVDVSVIDVISNTITAWQVAFVYASTGNIRY